MINNYINQNLPLDKEIIIKIDEKTESIQKISGIKIPFYKHQQVLLKQIINFIENGCILIANGRTLQNKNIWIKSDIGTGKSLIFLSLVQYFKNQDYQKIPLKVPYKSEIFTGISAYDKIPFKCDIKTQSYYQQLHNVNYVLNEIQKTTGFVDINSTNYKMIEFLDFQKQALLFAQKQVIQQFIQYIKEQTSLSYFLINNNIDFVKFMVENIKEDVIIWNTDEINVESAKNNLSVLLRQAYRGEENQELLKKTEQIKQYYSIQEEYNFNKFWIEHMNKRQHKPYAFIAFDDFDTIQIMNAQQIPSLINVFIGSTSMSQQQQFINTPSSFIFNKYINHFSSFRIDQTQLKQILNLPNVNVNNILCNTPSTIYSQFEYLKYIFNIFSIIYQILQKHNKQPIQNDILQNKPTDDDYNSLLCGTVNIPKLYSKYLNNFNFHNTGQSYQFLIFFMIMQQLETIFKIYKCGQDFERTADKRFRQKQEKYQNNIFNNLDNILVKKLLDALKEDIKIAPQIQEKIDFFKIDSLQLKKLEIIDPFTNKYINKPCVATCCGTIFDYDNIKQAINVSNEIYYCSCCKRQIMNIDTFAYYENKLLTLKGGDFLYTPVFEQEINYLGQTKLQFIKTLIDKNRGKKAIIYMQDKINIQSINKGFCVELSKWKYETKDELKKLILESKPVGIEYYQPDQDYDRYKQFQAELLKQIIENLQKIVFATEDYDKRNVIFQTFNELKEEYIQPIPDIIIINSLKQIVGENMTYVDNFIFVNIPQNMDEYLQIIGRSNRINRIGENNVYMLYYPQQKHLFK